MNKFEQLLWCEKYRPHKIEDCVLPKHLFDTFTEFVKTGKIPNLLLYGRSGIGKTTVARAMCDELDMDYIIINGSEENGIDILRNKIRDFAITKSFSGKRKFIIVDEGDYLSPACQAGLRGVIEEVSNNCGFIITANFKDRLLEAIHSRCTPIEFKVAASENKAILIKFIDRCANILKNEKVKHFDPEAVGALIKHFFPDFRRIIGELQNLSATKDGLSKEVISRIIGDGNVDDLMVYLKSKNFKKIREWVVENIHSNPTTVIRKIYESLSQSLESQSIPPAILVLADYQDKAIRVADQEINMMAMMIELMSNCSFKS